MKKIKWKILFITSLVCLLPILLGVVLWDKLPDTIATHFDINNNPDGYSPKWFAVFGLPILMALLQIISCVANDINVAKHGEIKKIEYVTKWIIPVISVLLYAVTLGYAMELTTDIRTVAILIVGAVFVITGNYLPKLDYIKNYNIDTAKAKKINRFVGFETVIMGILFLISLFLEPFSSVICVIMLIPYSIISIIYSVIVIKKK